MTVVERQRDNPAHPLSRLRGLIRTYIVLDSLLTIALFLAAAIWIAVVFDYGLFKLANFDWVLDSPKSLRIAALSLALLLLAGIVITRLVLRLRREFSDTSLALLLEKRFPAVLGDRLITAVEMADVESYSRAGYSAEMIRSTVEDAAARLDTVPVETVFNWARLRRRCWLLAGLLIGLLAVSYVAYATAYRTLNTTPFLRKSSDVAYLLAKRNLLIAQAPWPRRAHLVVLVPSREVHYAGRDMKPHPKVVVKAYAWVVADDSETYGWRPLLWKELPEYVDNRPDLEKLPQANGMPFPADVGDWDLDRVEAALGRSNEEVVKYFERLERLTERSRLSLRLRKLEIPETLSLTHTTADGVVVKLDLTREPGNIYQNEIDGLTESVRYRIRGADFTTLPRTIELVNAPTISEIGCVEYQPAYLYHAPPLGPGPPDFTALAGLVQRVDAGQLSLTGERSQVEFALGSEFELRIRSDKPLLAAFLVPWDQSTPGGARQFFRYTEMASQKDVIDVKDGLVTLRSYLPGIAGRTETGLFSDEGRTLTVPFRKNLQVSGSFEFDLVLVDEFNVARKRTIAVKQMTVANPSIDLAIDALRLVGDPGAVVKSYKVTPAALVPFKPTGRVVHSRGIGQVDFHYEVRPVDAAPRKELQYSGLAGAFAHLPVAVSVLDLRSPVADQYSAWVRMAMAHALFRPDKPETGTWPLTPYLKALSQLKRYDREELKSLLEEPLESGRAQVIREVAIENPREDGFDLNAVLPNLAATLDAVEGAGFQVDLTLHASDANSDPKRRLSAKSSKFRLLVVTEAELLLDMTADEKKTQQEFDLALRALETSEKKLRNLTSYLRTDDFEKLGDQPLIRVKEIGQDYEKQKKAVKKIVDLFNALDREAEFNRVGVDLNDSAKESGYRRRLQRDIITPLQKQVLDAAFPELEQMHGIVRQELDARRKPTEAMLADDLAALERLVALLKAIQKNIQAAASFEKAKENLEKIVETQEKVISRFWKNFKVQKVAELSLPKLEPLKPIEIAAGQSKKIVHPVNWNVYTGALSVSFQGPGDDKVKVPAAAVKLDEDRFDFDYTLTAGNTPGEYMVKLVPSVGAPLEIKIIVK